MNTETSTAVMPTMAPPICFMALMVACRASRPSSCMMRSTFSTTTMASSTRMPMLSTMPNMVSMLTENPEIHMTAKVPSRATGTTSVGISVARKFWRNRNMTRNTRPMASSSVETTFWMEISTKWVVSYGIW